MEKKNRQALALISGGLDSSLAAWLVKKQGIKVKGIIFKSVFFGPEKAIKAAKQLKIPYQIIDISKELIRAIKNPAHGFGGAANPCIDCHLIMVKKAKEIMEEKDFDFVVTGEVAGQRPFSQNKHALKIIAEQSGLGNRLVRPLSAKKLEPTLPEKKGWLDRDKLLGISGRGRKKQIKLAGEADLFYDQPAGGCILTESGFGKKVFDLKKHFPEVNINDAKLLKIGRHYWQGDNLVVVGKDENENKQLERLARPGDLIVSPANFIGPEALIRGKNVDKSLTTNTKHLVLKHTPPRKKELFRQPLIFFGSSSDSVLVLKKLLTAGIAVGGIVTKPDSKCGRGQKKQDCPAAEFGKKENIPTFKFSQLDYKTRNRLEQKLKYRPYWGVVAVYGNIIPSSWLKWFNIIVNIHPSLLPKWRGAAPTIRAIEAGDKTTGWTIFKIVKEMDAGPIIAQKKTKIKANETAGELTTRLFKSAGDHLVEIFSQLYQAKEPMFWELSPQKASKATYAEKIDKKEAKIDWSQPAEKIVNKIRALNPYPSAYTTIKINGREKRLKIWRAKVNKGRVVPEIVHLAGKCRCSWEQFSRDYEVNLEDLKNAD